MGKRPTTDPVPAGGPETGDRQGSHHQARPHVRGPVRPQVETGPGDRQSEHQAPGSSSAPEEECHETHPAGDGGMAGRKRAIGVATDHPTTVFPGTKPPLLHRHLRPGPADHRSENRSRQAGDDPGQQHGQHSPGEHGSIPPAKPTPHPQDHGDQEKTIGRAADDHGQAGPRLAGHQGSLRSQPVVGREKTSQDRQTDQAPDQNARPEPEPVIGADIAGAIRDRIRWVCHLHCETVLKTIENGTKQTGKTITSSGVVSTCPRLSPALVRLPIPSSRERRRRRFTLRLSAGR